MTGGGQERVVQPQGLTPRLCLRHLRARAESGRRPRRDSGVSEGRGIVEPLHQSGRKDHVDLPEEKQDTRLNLNFTQMVNNLSVERCPKHCMQNYLH